MGEIIDAGHYRKPKQQHQSNDNYRHVCVGAPTGSRAMRMRNINKHHVIVTTIAVVRP